MDLQLDQHVLIVTGGSGGVGLATAECLVAEGARVVVSGRTQERVDAAVRRLGDDRAEGVVADNADPRTPSRLVAAARTRWRRLDGALISVGGPPAGGSLAMEDQEWRDSFESVFLGAVRLLRVVGEELPEGGSLAVVLSSSVRSPLAGLGISNGLRPGLAMVAKELADQLGPRGVRVNGLMPARIETDRVLSLDAGAPDPAAARAAAERSIPLGRYGRPEEFGRVAAFVLSPAASYLSGVMLPVDGGMLRGL
ncbi:SDR family oxidoreductase [Nocardioides campestrisoli]|uniref:SDR family oxidoreductase n=1 Tax=Nocardioides campestrisoli TaxID=2736757 RepID=UPI0015E7B1F0|nr:SDR family oxidoreductase [Nocardioides campestrisoli]